MDDVGWFTATQVTGITDPHKGNSSTSSEALVASPIAAEDTRMDDDFLDGCDIDMSEDNTTDEEVALFPLFAEALDPNNPKTVEEAESEWRELLT